MLELLFYGAILWVVYRFSTFFAHPYIDVVSVEFINGSSFNAWGTSGRQPIGSSVEHIHTVNYAAGHTICGIDMSLHEVTFMVDTEIHRMRFHASLDKMVVDQYVRWTIEQKKPFFFMSTTS